jgi:hypothetical protein
LGTVVPNEKAKRSDTKDQATKHANVARHHSAHRIQMHRAKMTPEERVATAISMSTVVTQVCADGIRDWDPSRTGTSQVAKMWTSVRKNPCEQRAD